MLFNIVTMYLYAKAFEAMTEKPHYSPRKEPERDDLSKRSFSSDHYQVEKQVKVIVDDVARLVSPDCQDRPEVARGIQKVAEAIGPRSGISRSVAAVEQSLAAIDSLVTDHKQKNGIKDSLVLAIAALTRNSSYAWQGWVKYLGSASSEEVVYAGLQALKRGDRRNFSDPDSREAMLAASGRSERCREAVMALEPLFSKENFAENRERMLLMGQKSMESGSSNERANTIRMFKESGLAQELIPAALTALEREFEKTKTAENDRLQLSKLNTVMYCFPRHLFAETTQSQQALDALPRLQKLRDNLGDLVKSTGAGWGDNYYANFLSYVCDNIKVAHNFSSIVDWTRVLIPQLREPVYLSGECAFQVLTSDIGSRILDSFSANSATPEAKAALPELEKVFETALKTSIASPGNTALSLAVGKLDTLCSLIAGRHEIERTTSVDSTVEKMEDRWLTNYASVASTRHAESQLPYRTQVDHTVATRAASIVEDAATRSLPAFREFTASLIRENGTTRPFYDLLGKAADRIALVSIGWGKPESVTETCITLLNAKEPKERVAQLIALSGTRRN